MKDEKEKMPPSDSGSSFILHPSAFGSEGLTVSPPLLGLLTFLAAALAVLGAYSVLWDLFLRDRSRFTRRVDEEFRHHLRDQELKLSLFKALRAPEPEALAEEDDRPGLRQRVEVMLEQSGLDLTPDRLLAVTAGGGGGPGGPPGVFSGPPGGRGGRGPGRGRAALAVRPPQAEGPAGEAPGPAARHVRPDGPGHPRRADRPPGHAGRRRRVRPARCRGVFQLLRAAEPGAPP